MSPDLIFLRAELGQCPGRRALAITLDEGWYLGYRAATFSKIERRARLRREDQP
jgi:hypothetical protein